MLDIIQEEFIHEQTIPVSIEATTKILYQMNNCLCEIYQKNVKLGIGFLCKIPYPNNNNNLLPVLIANNNIVNKNDKYIKLIFSNKVKEIKINNSRKKYINPDNSISIIEIKPNKDKIFNYLELDENDLYENKENLELEYENKSIYIMHYINETLSVSYCIINYLMNNKKIEYGCPILSLKTFKIIGIYNGNCQNNIKNHSMFIKYLIDKFNECKNKNELNIIYKTDKEGDEDIFGEDFVENNKNNIELIINGSKNDLINRYKLEKGENIIKIIIKNEISNLESMFYNCKSLKNLKELEYLKTKDIKNFSLMFFGCSSLSD